MRKPIITILALLIALSLIFASAEGINLIEQLRSSENKSFGAENGVYEAWYALLNKANGGNLPLNHWDVASTYISKLGIGEALSPEEQVFDQSLSAYEKYFLMSLTDATLSDEEGQALTTLFQEGLKNFPTDGQPLYITPEPETEAYMIGLMRQGTEMMGVKYALEPIDETTSLYAVLDEQGAGIISARKALTSLPAAMLMKHVPADKQQESAAVLARIEAAIPDTIDWKAIISGDDVDVENADWLDDVGLEEDDVEEEIPDENPDPEATPAPELTEEQQNELTAKWLKLLYACDAFDAQGDENSVKLVTEALYAITAERPEVHLQPEGGISLNYPASMITPTPAPTKAPAASTPKPGSSFVIPVSPNYRQSYVIYVSKHSRTIAIIGKDSSGQFSKCLRKFSTGVGKGGSTRAGTFEVYKKERWRSWSGNLYSPYCTRIGPAHIHGPMYNAKNSGSMVPGSYNEIGTECSAGCLRTTCAAAAWVYYNCPVGTACIIAEDSRFKASKPKKIPGDQTWDPTDKDVEIPVTGITISPNPVRVKPKETVKLSLKLEPEGSNTTKFSYESTDKSIATVDSEGRVAGVKIGKCAVKVTAADVNGYSTKVDVEVIDPNSTPTPTPVPTAATPTPTPTVTPEPTATPAPDPEVLKAQTYLAILYPLDNVAIDGQNSDAVKAEIAKFQQEYNAEHPDAPLEKTDGTLDDATKTALKAEAYKEVLDLVPVNGDGIDGFEAYTDEQKAELAIKQFQEAYNKEHTEAEQQLNTEGKLDQDDNKTVNQLVAKAQIAEIQSMLNKLGKLDAYTKGTLDDATVDAIKAFQTENGIEATGELDDATKSAIKKAYEDAVAQGIITAASFDEDNLFAMEVVEEPELIAQSAEEPVEETIEETIEETAEEVVEAAVPLSGDSVKDAQTYLAILHWLEEDDIDGQFGGQTQTALARFQHSWNSQGEGDALPEDGMLDEATLNALAKAAKRRVAEVQELLAKLNLLDADHVTGNFDGETKAAVLEFQNKVNEKAGVQRLSPTGKVDENTLRDLRGGYITVEQAEAEAERKARIIDKDSDAKDIAHVQKLLNVIELLDEEDFEEGEYDEATEDAVSKFQEMVNEDNEKVVLEITGTVDEDTLEYLEAYAKKYKEAKGDVEADAETPEPTETETPAETPEAEPVEEPAEEEVIVEAAPVEEAEEEIALEIVEELPEPEIEYEPEPEPEEAESEPDEPSDPEA